MSYQALYRVWRPQVFSDLVGQEFITKTLKNALLTKQTTHAYLFTGPRGTGKTSAAKIFAKAINCRNQKDGEPCNQCETCKAITAGRLNDVIEIDAASNNGVEEIRDIRDKAKYAPTQADYKVYIIDEVHMLSTGAFNALLKTLEEPPTNVVFILATTEPHKIPTTIISRTQRFDFRRITPQAILKRMEYILQQKGFTYDEAALKVIAKAAEGGMRDALSILDQVLSFGDNQVTLDNALLVTGSVTRDNLTKYLHQVVAKDTSSALATIHEILEDGKDAKRLIEDLINYCRDLLLYQQAPKLVEESELGMLDNDFKKFAGEVDPEQLYQMIDILNEQQENMRFTVHEAIYLEVLTVKLSRLQVTKTPVTTQVTSDPATDAKMSQLQKQLNALEQSFKQLQTSGVPAKTPTPPRSNRKATKQNGELKLNLSKIYEVLDQASKQDLMQIRQVWGDLMNMLNVTQRAMMQVAKPVAASSDGVVIGFEYDILCQRALENQELQDVLGNGLSRLLGAAPHLIFIPGNRWPEIRSRYLSEHGDVRQKAPESDEQVSQAPSQPVVPEVVAKAQELFGEQLVEAKND